MSNLKQNEQEEMRFFIVAPPYFKGTELEWIKQLPKEKVASIVDDLESDLIFLKKKYERKLTLPQWKKVKQRADLKQAYEKLVKHHSDLLEGLK